MVNFLPSKKKRVPLSLITVQSHTKKSFYSNIVMANYFFKEKRKTHEDTQ